MEKQMNRTYEVVFTETTRKAETFTNAEMRISEGFLHFLWVTEVGKKWDEAWINASLVERVKLKQSA
jgi:hypothetical protein